MRETTDVRGYRPEYENAVETINFAIDEGLEAATFLRVWREGDWKTIDEEWPEFRERIAALEPAPKPAGGEWISGGEVTLAECPIGLFMAGDELCLKTEYGNNEGRIDAYIVSSGEFFWGSTPQTIANQRAQRVRPVAAPVPPSTDGAVDVGELVSAARIKEVMAEESANGAACGWKSCSGCHETNEGAETGDYPYSEIFGCYVGSGCGECGGIGVVWEYWDKVSLDEMARENALAPRPCDDPVSVAREIAADAYTSVGNPTVARLMRKGEADHMPGFIAALAAYKRSTTDGKS